MNIFKLLFFCFFSLSPLVSSAANYSPDCISSNTLDDNKVVARDKIYIMPEQIYISQEGIFIFDKEAWIRVEQLNWDENGMYCFGMLDKIIDKCPNGHKIWCGRCGGCVTRWCKFRCKCVEWE